MAPLKFFVLGHPIGQSKSPAMQNAALAHLGIDGLYAPLDVPESDLDTVLARLEDDPSVLGCNVTVPHKVAVHKWLSSRGRTLRPRAGIAQAVNTLYRGPDGLFHGDSTDFDGAMDAILREAFDGNLRAFASALPTLDVAVLGSGGAARSIATNLAHPWNGTLPHSITIMARHLDKARDVADAIGPTSIPVDIAYLADFRTWNAGRHSLVIQTTTVGMESGEAAGHSPIPSESHHPGQIAFDLVYKPYDTPFLQDAATGGATIVHGIGMLVGQGARSLELWTRGLVENFDRQAVTEAMERALGI